MGQLVQDTKLDKIAKTIGLADFHAVICFFSVIDILALNSMNIYM